MSKGKKFNINLVKIGNSRVFKILFDAYVVSVHIVPVNTSENKGK